MSGKTLSHTQIAILTLIAQGLSNKEIAHKIDRETWTVNTHVRRIFRKLDVRNRTHAVTKAIQEGIIHV